VTPHRDDVDQWATDPNREKLIHWLVAQSGKMYVWCGKGPETFDCSGLVTASMQALDLPDWRATHNAARLFAELEPIEFFQLRPGDLVFYGQPGQISHVMFFWTPEGEVYGACGGNSSTTSPEVAMKAGACVKSRRSVLYRPDVRGYRRYPFPKEEHDVIGNPHAA